MKYDDEQQALINDFKRQYADIHHKIQWGVKTFEMKNGVLHDDAVHRVCHALHLKGLAFATEVRLKCGNVADVVCPAHVKPIIEVMSTESDNGMARKILRLPLELQKGVIVLKADDVMKLFPSEVVEGVFLS